MRAQFNFILAILMMFAFALDASPVNRMIVKIEKGDDAAFINLRVANLQKVTTKIALFDVTGKSWYHEYVSDEDGYAKKVITAGMPNNDYILYVGNENGHYMQAFSIASEKIAFFEKTIPENLNRPIAQLVSYHSSEEGKLIAHLTKEENHSVGVLLANLKWKPTEIKIVRNTGEVILKEKVEDNIGYATKFNMKGMPDGAYFLYVEASDAKVVMVFTVKENRVKFYDTQRLEKITGSIGEIIVGL